MRKVLAIDPGNTESAYVLLNPDYRISNDNAGKWANKNVLNSIEDFGGIYGEELTVVIEMVASYGMAVGREVFETCVWIGRFIQTAIHAGCGVDMIYRIEEKQTLCHDSRAKDSNIRQALIDRFARFDRKNGKGTKTHPDVFYGFRADMWSAFAVGATWLDKQKEKGDQKDE